MIVACEGCDYDWRENSLDLQITLSHRLPEAPRLHCPVCGIRHAKLEASQLGVAGEAGDDDRPIWEDLRPKHIVFKGARARSVDHMFFSGVPVFSHPDRGATVPHIPIRPEFWSLFDLARYHELTERHGDSATNPCRGVIDRAAGRYRAKVPFVGRRDLQPVDLPLIGSNGRPATGSSSEAITGVAVGVWPRVRNANWRTYVVHAEIDRASVGGGELDVMVIAGKGTSIRRARQHRTTDWHVIEPLPFKGFGGRQTAVEHLRAVVSGGRPQGIAVATGDGAGGIFLPDPSAPASPGGGTVNLGLDFGTSNSCVGVDYERFPGDEARVARAADLSEHLISGARVDRTDAGRYAPMFPRRVFGPGSDLFPSELLTTDPAQTVAAMEPAGINALVPGIDYAVPGDDVKWQEISAEAHILDGLKWGGDLGGAAKSDGTTRKKNEHVIAYLKALFTHAMAELVVDCEARQAKGAVGPGNARISYSYPGRWAETQSTALKNALEAALEGGELTRQRVEYCVRDWYDIEYTVNDKPMIEAFAAAQVALEPTAAEPADRPHKLKLLVDIGGGTTDIAGVWERRRVSGLTRMVEYVTSFKYAGDDLLRAFAGPPGKRAFRVFAAGQDLTRVRRKIRGHGVTDDLFDRHMRSARNDRTNSFYTQLTELLARFAVAPVLNGQDARRNGNNPKRPLRVEIIRLGNGWGFGGLVAPQIDAWLRIQVQQRVTAILSATARVRRAYSRSLHAYEPARPPRIMVDVKGIKRCHPKHAVALGLLTQGGGLRESTSYASDKQLMTSLDQRLGEKQVADEWGVESTVVEDDPNDASGTTTDPNIWQGRSIVGLPLLKVSEDGVDTAVAWWQPVEMLGTRGFFQKGVHWPKLDENSDYFFASERVEAVGLQFPEELAHRGEAALKRALDSSEQHLNTTLDMDNGWFSASPYERLLETGLVQRLQWIV